MVNTSPVCRIVKSDTFNQWLNGLQDLQARARIAARLDRMASGNVGDAKPVGSGVSELRIDCGPGYRVYFKQRGPASIALLCGGDKGTQSSDIKRAIAIAESWQE